MFLRLAFLAVCQMPEEHQETKADKTEEEEVHKYSLVERVLHAISMEKAVVASYEIEAEVIA